MGADAISRDEASSMAVCEEIRQSVDVGVPVGVANGEWTQFLFLNLYARGLETEPDESEAEPDVGFVRLEGLDDHTRVTVDLNYCAHFEGIDDSEEIGRVQRHLHKTLARYKRFVESTKA
jgi:hypothetical protein